MKIGVCILAHNSLVDIDRCLFALHHQTWPSWGGHIFDIESSEDITEYTSPLNAIRQCDVMRSRLLPHRVHSHVAFPEAVSNVLSRLPAFHVVGFIGAHVRLDVDALFNVNELFSREVGVIQFKLRNYWQDVIDDHELDVSPEVIRFCRIDVVRNYLPILSKGMSEVTYQFDERIKSKVVGDSPLGTSFRFPSESLQKKLELPIAPKDQLFRKVFEVFDGGKS